MEIIAPASSTPIRNTKGDIVGTLYSIAVRPESVEPEYLDGLKEHAKETLFEGYSEAAQGEVVWSPGRTVCQLTSRVGLQA